MSETSPESRVPSPEPKFTPGPWRWERGRGGERAGWWLKGESPVAYLSSYGNMPNLADRTLIEQAPSLYHRVEQLLWLLNDMDVPEEAECPDCEPEEPCATHAVIRDARAAIDTALGEPVAGASGSISGGEA